MTLSFPLLLLSFLEVITIILRIDDFGTYKVIGSTRDDAASEHLIKLREISWIRLSAAEC